MRLTQLALKPTITPATEATSRQCFGQAKATFVAVQVMRCADVQTPIYQSAQPCVLG